MMNEQNQKIEVAHTREEMFHILKCMRMEGYHTDEIHIIAREASDLEDVKWNADVKTHEAGNWFDQIKSWFTGETAVTEGLKRFDLTEGQTAYYAQLVEEGAIVLYAEHDDNIDPTSATLGVESQRAQLDALDTRVTPPESIVDETPAQREERLKAEERMNDAEQIRRYL
ncbi:general stress protein [Lysinibacillus sphaericus]|uniref:general stress protein n=1 Tax=Lysinibacillus sphaericus TaxID=1421 RepID=UPI00216353DC|nr:general stress protein [Lysinibacillus sphaericus]MCS1382300.1 general stress protein [Lysinibacillus sphaericus]